MLRSSAARVGVCGGVRDNVVGFDTRKAVPIRAESGAEPRAQETMTGSVHDQGDDALMARIAQGDAVAARELMRRRLPRVVGMAQRMLNDPMEAEDVAQDTFLRVWKAAERWEPGRAQVSTWIGRIAINLCYDRLRKRREILTDAPPERADTAIDQEETLSRGETANRVAQAVAQLPDRQKQALELVHFQEMTNIAAAEIMEVSVDALESLLARGRRKLKALLLNEAGDLMSSYRTAPASHEGLD